MRAPALILLAAGASSRMGSPKQLIQLDGVPLVCRGIRLAIDAGCSPVFAVLGANHEQISPILVGEQAHVVINPEWKEGMSSSIRTGVQALAELYPDVESVMLMVVDQPGLNTNSLIRLRQALEAGQESYLAAAFYDGHPGTPAIFGKKLFPELLELQGETGARILLQRHRASLITVPMPEAIVDLDSRFDLARFRRQ
jgi:molybdenum cofactor cytidylyltransferase